MNGESKNQLSTLSRDDRFFSCMCKSNIETDTKLFESMAVLGCVKGSGLLWNNEWVYSTSTRSCSGKYTLKESLSYIFCRCVVLVVPKNILNIFTKRKMILRIKESQKRNYKFGRKLLWMPLKHALQNPWLPTNNGSSRAPSAVNTVKPMYHIDHPEICLFFQCGIYTSWIKLLRGGEKSYDLEI